jgi:hypothetical protein
MKIQLPGIERRPEIQGDLSSGDEVAGFFRDHPPRIGFQKGFHIVMDKLVAPHVVIAEGMSEPIREQLDSGDPTALVMTHHSWFDPSNDAAALHQEKEVFDPVLGRFVIPARSDYFGYPVLGSFIATGGARPMVRKKDLARHYKSQGLSEEEVAEVVEAKEEEREGWNHQIQRILINMSEDGHAYASYIEGSRNRGDQLKLQTVRDGIKGWLEAMDPEERERAKLLCLSHDYGGRFKNGLPGRYMKRFLTPTIYITMIDAPSDPEEVNGLLHETLEDGLSRARANRNPGAPLSPLGKFGILAATAVAARIYRSWS